MRALVKARPEPGLWLEDVAEPAFGVSDVRIRVRKAAICGTDLHIYRWDDWARQRLSLPLVVGHEFMGVVESVGAEVRGVQAGDRVTGEGHITCGHCRNCRAGRRHLCRNTEGIGIDRAGCFAELLTLPASNVFKIPDDISDELGAIFDPFGNATHATLSFDLVGEDVLITGAGPIGLMAAAIARHVGARFVVVSDVNTERLELARRMGVSLAIDPRRETFRGAIERLGMTEGFDVGLEMSGHAEAFQDMLAAMNHGGRVAILGIFPAPFPIDWSLVIFRGLHLKGIYGREMFETWYKMKSMLQSGLDIGGVITHRFPAAEFEPAFHALEAGRTGKVVLDWSS